MQILIRYSICSLGTSQSAKMRATHRLIRLDLQENSRRKGHRALEEIMQELIPAIIMPSISRFPIHPFRSKYKIDLMQRILGSYIKE